MKTCADETRAEAAEAVQGAPCTRVNHARVAAVHREHYFRWVGHVCRVCEPVYWETSCRLCTHPRQFRWVKQSYSDLMAVVRYIDCATPPYAPLSYAQSGILRRYDDVIAIANMPRGRKRDDSGRLGELSSFRSSARSLLRHLRVRKDPIIL